jgi:hypothetical protein
MEGNPRRPKPPLPVRREFAGSRIEQQILARVYELALPVVRRATAADALQTQESASDQDHPSQLAQGR